MVEIITEKVEMPEYDKRRFQKDYNGKLKRWIVTDGEDNTVIYEGSYENASLISHNLNKKYYRDKKNGKKHSNRGIK
jgi:hypothetical protein